MRRLEDLVRFYGILGRLEKKIGGTRVLSECRGGTSWPERGVYFFMESRENRTDSGEGSRVVRVGTHALKQGSKSKLWNRLKAHKGNKNGGNHRGSIFRLLVDTAVVKRFGECCPSWDNGKSSADRNTREGERDMERKVNAMIGKMPFIYLSVDDPASPESLRGYLERNAIALLSNWQKEPLDPSSSVWLGHDCSRNKVKDSGLWNQRHVDESYEPDFLDIFEELMEGIQ